MDADINKLKYEVAYRDERERGKGFNLNRYWRNSKRIELTDTSVRACRFSNWTNLPVALYACTIALCSVSIMQASYKYTGRRLRSRDDIHLLMYKNQLPVQN